MTLVNMALFLAAALVIGVAQTLLIVSAWQYSRQVKPAANAIRAGARFELLWAIAPVVLLVLTLWFSFQALVR